VVTRISHRRFTHLMERVPVHVITTRAALIGAAAYGLENLEEPLARTSP
jgi:glucokinase